MTYTFLLGLTIIFSLLLPQDDASKQIRELIEKLTSDNIEHREAASSALIKLGQTALPEIELAVKSKDIEMAVRAGTVLAAIRSQIAKDTFKKIEETVAKAKTVSVKITYDWYRKHADEAKRYRGTGTLLLKEGNRFSMTLKGFDAEEKKAENFVICDGSTFKVQGQLWNWTGGATLGEKLDAKDIFTTAFIRGGAASALDCWRHLPYGVAKIASTDEYSQIAEDNGSKTLRYKLTSSLEAGVAMDVNVWYHPKSFTLLKRTVEIKGTLTEGSFTETYDEFIYNTDISDEKFKLSEEKK
jgi:hypothetical protein